MKPAVILGAVAALVAAAVFMLLDSGSEPQNGGGEPTPITRSDARDETPTPRQDPRTSATVPVEVEREEVMTEGLATGAYQNALSGTVRGLDGVSVEGAELQLVHGVSGDEFSELEMAMTLASGGDVRKWRATTSADGSFSFENLPPGGGYRLRALHPDFTVGYKANFLVPETGVTTVELVLTSGFVLTGQIVSSETMEPVAEASLELVPVLAQLPGADKSGVLNTKTDNWGEYEFRNVPPGRYSLTVKAKGFASLTRTNLPFLGNPNGAEPTIQLFRLEPGTSLVGRVVDEEGQPIPRARIEASSFGTAQISQGQTVADKNGVFEVTELVSGTYVVNAFAKGFVNTTRNNVKLPGGELELTMARQGGVKGVAVANATDEPVAAFRANVRMTMPNSTDLGRTAATGIFQDGAFELGGLNAGNYVVEIESKEFAPSYSQPFTVELGQTTEGIEVRAVAGGTIVGRVVSSATGEAIRGALVETLDNSHRENQITKLFGAGLPRTTTSRRAKTDAEGRFELTMLGAGTYQIKVEHRDFPIEWKRDIAVLNDSEVDVGKLELEPGATVRGVVYDGNGAPVKAAKIHVVGMTIHPDTVLTNDKGEFKVSNLKPGIWTLSAQRTGLVNPLDAWPDLKQSEIIIDVDPGQLLEQNLYLTGGNAPADPQVRPR